jgi:hypothetical protein
MFTPSNRGCGRSATLHTTSSNKLGTTSTRPKVHTTLANVGDLKSFCDAGKNMKPDVAPLAIKTEANNPNPERLEATPIIPLMVMGVVEAETIRLATTEDHCGTIFF